MYLGTDVFRQVPIVPPMASGPYRMCCNDLPPYYPSLANSRNLPLVQNVKSVTYMFVPLLIICGSHIQLTLAFHYIGRSNLDN